MFSNRHRRVRSLRSTVLVTTIAGALVGCASLLDIEELPDETGEAPDVVTVDRIATDVVQPKVDAEEPPIDDDAGSEPDTGADADADAEPEIVCTPDSHRCNGNTVQKCIANAWVDDEMQCSGSAPVCSNGSCSPYRVSGGMGTLAAPSSDAGTIRLVSGGFELGPRSCSADGFCVTGSIQP